MESVPVDYYDNLLLYADEILDKTQKYPSLNIN